MVSMDVPNSENQFDWLEGSRYGSNCQKTYSTILQNFKKSQHTPQNCSKKNNFEFPEFRLQFRSFFAHRDKKRLSLQQQNTRRIQVRKVYKRTPPYLTYIRDAIDQGATRLGGL